MFVDVQEEARQLIRVRQAVGVVDVRLDARSHKFDNFYQSCTAIRW